jgi:sulfide:quinone oxidoreductase
MKIGVETAYDLLAYVPQHRAPQVVQSAGLASENGWITVNRDTLATTFPNVCAGRRRLNSAEDGKTAAESWRLRARTSISGHEKHRPPDQRKGNSAQFDGEGECFIETGDGRAGFGSGNFFAEPLPQVKVHAPARRWHAAKVLFEKDWLRRWF